MIPRMPRWQSYVATTTDPIFTPQQCQMIVNAGHAEAPEKAKVGGGEKGAYDTKKRVTTISWIPFNKLPEMYKQIENQLSIVNLRLLVSPQKQIAIFIYNYLKNIYKYKHIIF